MHAQLKDEIVAKAPSKVGLLAEYATALADAGVDIHAIGAYDKGGYGEFMMVTSDNDQAAEILAGLGADIQRNDVVVLDAEDRPGSLAEAADMLATAGINVDWVYATAGEGDRASIVIKTTDARSAQAALNS